MLTKEQVIAASQLLQERPAVLPGTRAILDENAAKLWYDKVCEVMQAKGVSTDADVWAFCDLAGVPD